MFTCGMYDYSGQWAYRVGVPAKSGVGGGVIAVVNRQLGIGTYSPRLDAYGNSCRGTEVCVELASRLGLHVFDCLNVGFELPRRDPVGGQSPAGIVSPRFSWIRTNVVLRLRHSCLT